MRMKREKHPHALAIDRIGAARIRAHYNLKAAALSQWKVRGVPDMLLASLRTLAAIHGVQAPELYQEQSS